MIFINIAILLAVAGAGWWLTGIDKTVEGESKQTHYVSRTIRCIIIVVLANFFLSFLEKENYGYGDISTLIIIPVSIGLILRSSLSEIFTQGVLRMIDPMLYDHSEIDPQKTGRHLDNIAYLIKRGRKGEAIKLCEELKKSGEVDAVTLETTLEFLGVKQHRTRIQKPIAHAAQLRMQENFGEAEQLLRLMLRKNPADVEAGILLTRLYATDLQQPAKAHKVLDELAKQPHVAPAQIEFARRSIAEWSQPQITEIPVIELSETQTVDELIAQKFFGSAVELLEKQIKAQPGNFELILKLAEVHATFCNNYPRAEKIVRQMQSNADFTSAQIAFAREKLHSWRK